MYTYVHTVQERVNNISVEHWRRFSLWCCNSIIVGHRSIQWSNMFMPMRRKNENNTKKYQNRKNFSGAVVGSRMECYRHRTQLLLSSEVDQLIVVLSTVIAPTTGDMLLSPLVTLSSRSQLSAAATIRAPSPSTPPFSCIKSRRRHQQHIASRRPQQHIAILCLLGCLSGSRKGGDFTISRSQWKWKLNTHQQWPASIDIRHSCN